ncbi:MAG: methyltransferase, TIGR04325 family [Alphaproteobacteria bacterium]|nr:methyltransferase, TIGR04325 family [Alphaproteobacteria bacterium]
MSSPFAFDIWEGIYPDFASAPATDAVLGTGEGAFEGAEWLGKMTARGERALAEFRSGGTIPAAAHSREYPLAIVAALTPTAPAPTAPALAPAESAPLRVLDFGGGMAGGYAGLRASLPEGRSLAFHCVENKAVCEVGRRVFADVSDLFFHDSLDDVPGPVDIVHAGSSLQYIADWASMLARLSRFKPRHLVLSDLPAGDIPTFVSIQNYYERRMCHWFWNLGDMLGELARLGYALVYRSRFEGVYLGKAGPYPMDNFPSGHRLGFSCNLILSPVSERP